jgi:hypothetical protein
MGTIDTKKIEAAWNQVRALCAKLPGAEEYVMVHHPAFRVGKKPFAIAGMDEHERGATLSVNLGREAQDGLLEDPRFSRTPYIGQHGWVTITQAKLGAQELAELVNESWRRIAPRKQLAALAASAGEPPTKKPPARKKPPAKKAARKA